MNVWTKNLKKLDLVITDIVTQSERQRIREILLSLYVHLIN
jgi:hypothetical protein